jgi:glycine betaine/choline ABC-type transport system substrate-binding protein
MGGRYTRRRALRAGGILFGSAFAGCSRLPTGGATTTPPTVAVGSKRFAENRILAYTSYELLRAKTALNVIDDTEFGGSKENWNAVRDGELTTYWEYTGTQYMVLEPTHEEPIDDPKRLYEAVADTARDQGVTVYERAQFDNSFVLLVTPEWRDETGVRTLSDLAAYVNAGNTDFAVALGEDFATRPDGWPGLTDHYGFDQAGVDAIETKTVSIGIPYDLLARGKVSVGMGFRTDPKIRRQNLVVLADDRDYFPTYNPIPVAHAETADALGLGEYLDRLGPALGDVSRMRRLNGRVVLDGESPRTVARSFLEREGLIPGGE